MPTNEAKTRLLEEKKRLEELRLQIEDEGILGNTGEAEPESDTFSELSGIDQHPADQGTETLERTRALSQLEEVEGRLAEIDRALEKVEEGTYGMCEICGREIDPERLEALPQTRYCLEHQQQVEREALGEEQASPREEA